MPKISVQVGGTPNQEPVEFELAGTDVRGNPIKPITFRCIPQMQGSEFLKIFEAGNEFDAGREALKVIEKAIVAEDQQLWLEVSTGRDIIVDMAALTEIAKGLLEVYGKNPTRGPKGSSDGSSGIGRTSMADFLSDPEPTLRPSVVIGSSEQPSP